MTKAISLVYTICISYLILGVTPNIALAHTYSECVMNRDKENLERMKLCKNQDASCRSKVRNPLDYLNCIGKKSACDSASIEKLSLDELVCFAKYYPSLLSQQ